MQMRRSLLTYLYVSGANGWNNTQTKPYYRLDKLIGLMYDKILGEGRHAPDHSSSDDEEYPQESAIIAQPTLKSKKSSTMSHKGTHIYS